MPPSGLSSVLESNSPPFPRRLNWLGATYGTDEARCGESFFLPAAALSPAVEFSEQCVNDCATDKTGWLGTSGLRCAPISVLPPAPTMEERPQLHHSGGNGGEVAVASAGIGVAVAEAASQRLTDTPFARSTRLRGRAAAPVLAPPAPRLVREYDKPAPVPRGSLPLPPLSETASFHTPSVNPPVDRLRRRDAGGRLGRRAGGGDKDFAYARATIIGATNALSYVTKEHVSERYGNIAGTVAAACVDGIGAFCREAVDTKLSKKPGEKMEAIDYKIMDHTNADFFQARLGGAATQGAVSVAGAHLLHKGTEEHAENVRSEIGHGAKLMVSTTAKVGSTAAREAAKAAAGPMAGIVAEACVGGAGA
ncbi:hypothetical protein HK405_006115, partial [Cladochytrium tenue]